MDNNEKIYDEQIFPLMTQIMEICKKNKISMFATFEYNKNEFCTSLIREEDYSPHYLFIYYDVLSHCGEKDGVNIDKIIMWMIKEAGRVGKHSSICLNQLGIDPQTGEHREKVY